MLCYSKVVTVVVYKEWQENPQIKVEYNNMKEMLKLARLNKDFHLYIIIMHTSEII
jgi:hypothetical protein